MVLENILQTWADKEVFVRVFTLNGFQMKGVIKQVDSTGVLLHSDGVDKLVRVDAISTVMPEQNTNK